VRTRRTLASTLLVLLALIAWAPPAAAQEEGGEEEHVFTAEEIEEITHEAELIAEQNGGTEFDAHCIEILTEGGSADDCQEAPSPILPEASEVLWGGITFVILFFLLRKFAYPAIKQGMASRSERIRADLDAAESAKADAQGVLDQYKAQLADARSEAARIIEEARQAADNLKRDQESRVQAEISEMRARAAADVESAKQQAVADASHEIAALAVGAAEVVVKRNLDQQAQLQLIEDYINQVGRSRA
jgi:F-type H+-transporting ATPase subunit b